MELQISCLLSRNILKWPQNLSYTFTHIFLFHSSTETNNNIVKGVVQVIRRRNWATDIRQRNPAPKIRRPPTSNGVKKFSSSLFCQVVRDRRAIKRLVVVAKRAKENPCFRRVEGLQNDIYIPIIRAYEFPNAPRSKLVKLLMDKFNRLSNAMKRCGNLVKTSERPEPADRRSSGPDGQGHGQRSRVRAGASLVVSLPSQGEGLPPPPSDSIPLAPKSKASPGGRARGSEGSSKSVVPSKEKSMSRRPDDSSSSLAPPKEKSASVRPTRTNNGKAEVTPQTGHSGGGAKSTMAPKRSVADTEMESRSRGKRQMIDVELADAATPKSSSARPHDLRSTELTKKPLTLLGHELTDDMAMKSMFDTWTSFDRLQAKRSLNVTDLCRNIAKFKTAESVLTECLMEVAWDAEAAKEKLDEELSSLKAGNDLIDVSRENLKEKLKAMESELSSVKKSWEATKLDLQAEKVKVKSLNSELAKLKEESDQKLNLAKADAANHLEKMKQLEADSLEKKRAADEAAKLNSKLKHELEKLHSDLDEKDKLIKVTKESSRIVDVNQMLDVIREFARSSTFEEIALLMCCTSVMKAFDKALNQLKFIKKLDPDFHDPRIGVFVRDDLTPYPSSDDGPNLEGDIFAPLLKEMHLWVKEDESEAQVMHENEPTVGEILRQMEMPQEASLSPLSADLVGFMGQMASTSGLANEELVKAGMVDANFSVEDMMVDSDPPADPKVVR